MAIGSGIRVSAYEEVHRVHHAIYNASSCRYGVLASHFHHIPRLSISTSCKERYWHILQDRVHHFSVEEYSMIVASENGKVEHVEFPPDENGAATPWGAEAMRKISGT